MSDTRGVICNGKFRILSPPFSFAPDPIAFIFSFVFPFFFSVLFLQNTRAGAQKLESEPLEYEDPNEGVAMMAMGPGDDSGSSEVRTGTLWEDFASIPPFVPLAMAA